MSVDAITTALAALDTTDVATKLESDVVYVCDATQAEWNAFTESEAEVAFHLKYLEWDRGKIYIVELPSREHSFITETIDTEIKVNTGSHECMNGYRDGDVPVGRTNRQPDSSYGPVPRAVIPLGGRKPRALSRWIYFRTLIVEIGYSRTWGNTVGYLDWKANHVWATHPGVQYILCVAIGPRFETCAYKLYTVVAHNVTDGPRDPVDVTAESNTVVALDSRRLLGLPRGGELPPGFPDPFTINLSAALQSARDTDAFDDDDPPFDGEQEEDVEMEAASRPAAIDGGDAGGELGEG